jgi:hypothetical protein
VGKKEAGELASKRIQETAGKLGGAELPAGTPLFTRTEQPPIAEDPPAGEPVTQGRGRTRKTRTYEKSHPIYAFRIRPEDSARLDALAERLQVTRDALASGLMAAVLDAVDGGRLSLYVDREPVQKRDTLGRLRSHVQTTIRAAWANLAEREKGK